MFSVDLMNVNNVMNAVNICQVCGQSNNTLLDGLGTML